AGHRGVATTFGAVEETAYSEGFHWKWPWVTITEVNTQEQVTEHAAAASSKDLQAVNATVAVTYHAVHEEVWWIYQNLGEERFTWETIKLNPIIAESVKSVTANFKADDLIGKRQIVKVEVETLIRQRALKEAKINVTSVNITDFDFSASFNASIEAKVRAEQDTLRAQNELKREEVEQEKQVVKAEAEKKMAVLDAEGKAEAIALEAKARAEANNMLAESITPEILRYMQLERWDGVLPRVTGGAAPFVLVDPDKE
ncbi:MAG: prohibitin family protein, partial [Nitrospira sp.]|nr:prohibitin family protein [Nitrospira sp.]